MALSQAMLASITREVRRAREILADPKASASLKAVAWFTLTTWREI